MACDCCKLSLKEGLTYDLYGKVICEDCYHVRRTTHQKHATPWQFPQSCLYENNWVSQALCAYRELQQEIYSIIEGEHCKITK
jgi:hypothetical protein